MDDNRKGCRERRTRYYTGKCAVLGEMEINFEIFGGKEQFSDKEQIVPCTMKEGTVADDGNQIQDQVGGAPPGNMLG
jgi:hypothetical protein